MRTPHPHRAGTLDWIVFLVTGPEEKLLAWQEAVMVYVEIFDRREQTVRCRAHGQGRGQIVYDQAVKFAKQHDVTLQDLVNTGHTRNAQQAALGQGASVMVSDCVEEYPVVHLSSHGMKWPDYLPKKVKKQK